MTLLASAPSLLPGYSARLSAALAGQLEAQGVTLRLGGRVAGLETADRPFAGALTAAGEALTMPWLSSQRASQKPSRPAS